MGLLDGSDTGAVPLIGIEPSLSDCVIKNASGSSYYTLAGSLAGCSPVLRDLVQCCGQEPSTDKMGDDPNPSMITESFSGRRVLEIPVQDPDEEVIALIELLHQPDRFLLSVVPTMTQEGATRILNLTPIAFKYDMQGNLARHYTPCFNMAGAEGHISFHAPSSLNPFDFPPG
jgi:hypothetical protein